jgi:ABC-type transporter Mla maintaining outer membrane lipid asymmetry ATPase subunit MlaF
MLIRTSRLSYLAPAKGRAGHDVVLLKDVTVGISATTASSPAIEVGEDRNFSGAVTVIVGPSGSGKPPFEKWMKSDPL